MASSDHASLPYEEPSIVAILIQSSFLLLLNILNWALDRLLYCGLIGQILAGVAWGTPGGQFLSIDVEHTVVQLGYIGLILLVFEGGLSTSFPSLTANMALSTVVALTGICAPIGLSFILGPLLGASSLQCFAAGAALCSTSLGTTFTVLRASGLTTTRLGVVLTSAAILDDVVGLIIVQVISNLGASSPGASSVISAATIVRPVLVSVAFVAIAVPVCRFIVRPATVGLNGWRAARVGGRLDGLLRRRGTALALHTALLVALVTGSSYAGTSNLFAAYIAGAAISWWDSEVPHLGKISRDSSSGTDSSTSGSDIYDRYYHPAVKRILQPFFFASIGFSIPITRMFSGSVVWRGIVYAILMVIGKLLCGIWLLRFPAAVAWFTSKIKRLKIHGWKASQPLTVPPRATEKMTTVNGGDEILTAEQTGPLSNHAHDAGDADDTNDSPADRTPTDRTPVDRTEPPSGTAAQTQARNTEPRNSTSSPAKPLSLYPAAILGLAMVPRGEIGFLISAVAQSRGVLGGGAGSGESEIFLVVTWAIVLCTLVGPIGVGLLVRRVKDLEQKAGSSAGRGNEAPPKDVLGVWGM